MIVDSLGYCCEWAFWKAHQKVSTSLIKERLGVDESTVRKHRAMYREGTMFCQQPKGNNLQQPKGNNLPNGFPLNACLIGVLDERNRKNLK